VLAGTDFGPFRIESLVGEGGMGVVYRAHDTVLRRDVALKVLPPALARDADRTARFSREARVLAALNHPHIAAIYGFERGEGPAGDPIHALVLEFVDGPTLADRIARGPLPLDEALSIARQIALAVEAAHEQGIVHRDLKPGNIKLRPDGVVKVLDFGLAKALESPGAIPSSVMDSPTVTSPTLLSRAGMLMGTAAYMSPEQARGRPADKRSDIWAFGCVLYEMLTGRRPFGGEEISDTLVEILKSDPDWSAVPADAPPAIRRLLRRCLQKDPRNRLADIADARLELDDAEPAARAEPDAVARGTSRRHVLVIAAALIAGVLIGAGSRWFAARPPDPQELRLEISAPQGRLTQFAIAPDGRSLAYATTGRRRIVIRDFGDGSPRPVPGTEGGEYPFWSPDGRAIGFFADNKLKRIDVDGGRRQVLASVRTPAGGTWNRDGVILYVPVDRGGVFQVPAAGGASHEVTPRGPSPLATRWPQFLPDGRRFLFSVAGGEAAGVYVGELGTDRIRRVLAGNVTAVHGSGHLWFAQEQTLVAQAFDPSALELTGPVVRVADRFGEGGLFGPAMTASAAGPIAYRAGSEGSPALRRQLVWFDRSGKPLGTAGEEGALASNPNLSRDGRSLVLQRTVEGNVDLWLVDLDRNVTTRLTDSARVESLPVWSPDGEQVLFNTQQGLVTMRVDRRGAPQILLPLKAVRIACDWSSDGRYILYKELDEAEGTADLWVLPLDGDRQPVRILGTGFDERDGQFDPDVQWLAYESDESGAPEIYIQPFPGPGAKTKVSVAGGTQVRWRADGKELFYIDTDENLVAVPVDLTGKSPKIGTSVPLFRTNTGRIRSMFRQQYVVARDGQRFLIMTAEGDAPAVPVTVLFNWKPPVPR
jgi:Tol biopolymer transport system component